MSGRDSHGSLFSRFSKGFRRIVQSDDWQEFVGPDWLDRIMSLELTDRFFTKQGRSIARWTIATKEGRELIVFLKRHYVLSRWDGLLSVLFPKRAHSPGMQEWEHLKWAEGHAIRVPRAVAAAELVSSGGKLQSFIAIEELHDMLPLHEAVPLASQSLNPSCFRLWKKRMIEEIVRLSREFHKRGVVHKDWYFCHFYILREDCLRVPESWLNRMVVIDLHRMSHHSVTILYKIAKDLAQLLYSSEVEGVTDRDRLEFWLQYKKQVGWSRWVEWIALSKWRLYKRHDKPKG